MFGSQAAIESFVENNRDAIYGEALHPKNLLPSPTLPAGSSISDRRLAELEDSGFPCYYARFHHPVPPMLNAEPVGEFYTQSKTTKYVVEKMTYTLHGLIWRLKGSVNLTPRANVVYVRFIV